MLRSQRARVREHELVPRQLRDLRIVDRAFAAVCGSVARHQHSSVTVPLGTQTPSGVLLARSPQNACAKSPMADVYHACAPNHRIRMPTLMMSGVSTSSRSCTLPEQDGRANSATSAAAWCSLLDSLCVVMDVVAERMWRRLEAILMRTYHCRNTGGLPAPFSSGSTPGHMVHNVDRFRPLRMNVADWAWLRASRSPGGPPPARSRAA